ncbi:MAG: endonuclease III domain-containing protein [Eubacteriales bacterium]|nr:endonuclease III domain-containing protein [Eubacteriales bacterium]
MDTKAIATKLRQLDEQLVATVPDGNWWPASSRFEMMLGAILTQNTSWTQVEVAISALKQAVRLQPEAILALEPNEVETLIRPAGSFRKKASYLRAISQWYLERGRAAEAESDTDLRTELLAIPGVGFETADSILLYAYDRPVFIYDLYARRLLEAAGLGSYEKYQIAERALRPAVQAAAFTTGELQAFHGRIVDAGKLARKLGGWTKAYDALIAGNLASETS